MHILNDIVIKIPEEKVERSCNLYTNSNTLCWNEQNRWCPRISCSGCVSWV